MCRRLQIFWSKYSLFTGGLLSQGLFCVCQTSNCINIFLVAWKDMQILKPYAQQLIKLSFFVGVLLTCVCFVTVFLQVYESPSACGGPETRDQWTKQVASVWCYPPTHPIKTPGGIWSAYTQTVTVRECRTTTTNPVNLNTSRKYWVSR